MRGIRPDASGDITAPNPGETNAAIAWVHPRQGNYMQTPIVVSNRGFASSPVIHDGKVIVLCDVQTNSFLASFDINTGKETWRSPSKDVPTCSCPTIVESNGRQQIA